MGGAGDPAAARQREGTKGALTVLQVVCKLVCALRNSLIINTTIFQISFCSA